MLAGFFLRFLLEQTGARPGVFLRMFGGVPPGPPERFLTEASTLIDEARLVGALPKAPFLAVAAQALLGRSVGALEA